MSVTDFLSESRLVADHVNRSSAMQDVTYLLVNRLLAALGIVSLSPVMLLVAALIWKHDGSPILFGHLRVGRNGKLFRCIKFRSMATDSVERLTRLLDSDPSAREEWQRDRKLKDDPRVTSIGQFIRRTSLDELPQLFNVLRGEMTLVGPRPITFEELRRYGASRWHYLAVRPGITGLWQVSGRNNLTYEQRVELDRQYVERRGWRADIGILLRTVKVVWEREGVR